jgi:hypothetical protein
MSRNGRGTEPEFLEGAVRIVEDLNMTVDDVSALGFKVVRHWSGMEAVSEPDAFALSRRQRMIAEQREEERRRREVEREQRMAAEFAARVPRGIPAPEANMSAFEVMLSVDADDRPVSVYQELLDERLAAGKGA